MYASQVNLEYWFQVLYSLVFGLDSRARLSELGAFIAHLWTSITIVGYIVAVVSIFVIVYTSVKIYELRKREKEFYGTMLISEDSDENPRWKHIQQLMRSGQPSDWRTAILEADILLDDMLTRQGYSGESVGEKLKQVEASDFATLQQAWEAHKVRNDIAHRGSSFDLSQTLANRTVAHYEAVFREFELI